MKKKISFSLILMLCASCFGVSFSSERVNRYAESDYEIQMAINNIDLMMNNFEVSAMNTLQTAADESKTEETLNILSVEDAVKILKNDNYPIDLEVLKISREIEAYNKANEEVHLKNKVKELNMKFGLEEKGNNEVSYFTMLHSYALSYDTWSNLTTEEKALVILYPGEALIVNSCSSKAFSYTSTEMGVNGLGDKSDGFRHALWNALMDARLAEHLAYLFATAHESKSSAELNKVADDGYYEYQHREMDLHNNAEGRESVQPYEVGPLISDSTIISRIKSKLTNRANDIIWLHN